MAVKTGTKEQLEQLLSDEIRVGRAAFARVAALEAQRRRTSERIYVLYWLMLLVALAVLYVWRANRP